jgi:hypothetical protein
MAGGGVRGKGAGIAHGPITQVGSTIKGSHPFIQEYLQAGGMTTGTIVGEDINGTTSEYLISNFNKTGGAGKGTGIGRSNKPGVSRVWNPEGDHNNRLEGFNLGSPGHNYEKADRSGHNNSEKEVRNPERRINQKKGKDIHNPGRANHSTHSNNRETMKEGMEKKRIEGRMTETS